MELNLNFALSWLAACKAVAVSQGDLLGGLFGAGLVSGISHCAGMCGPFVLAQTSTRLGAVPLAAIGRLTRLGGAALLPYHLGRITTYAGLGMLAGGLAGGVNRFTDLRWLSGLLLLLAAALFTGQALPAFAGLRPFRRPAGGPVRIQGWLEGLARPLFAAPTGLRGYALGLALGLLPCGLIYAGLAAAAGSGSALAGGMAMASFAAGTVPGLVLVGLLGHLASRRWQGTVRRVGVGLLLINALLLAWIGSRILFGL